MDAMPNPAGESESDPWIGQKIGGYTIVRRLGQGGMGVIYLASHESLDRLSAIKFLPSDLAGNPAYIELFFREAKAAAKLAHPNIITVHDAGTLGPGLYFFVMEYVQGRDLRTLLAEQKALPVASAANYVRQAAMALGYAHQHGLIHRDVKPENLLLTANGSIKVADLGLAKYIGQDESMMTQTGDIMGSPVYMSPERLRDPADVGPYTDIYSLGGTFYHLITGTIPYDGTSPVIMSQHLNAPVPDPRKIDAEVPRRIAEMIVRMMAKEPKDRQQSMEEIVRDIEAWQQGTRRVTRGEGDSGTSSKKPALIAAAWLAVIALIGGGIYATKKSSGHAGSSPNAASTTAPASAASTAAAPATTPPPPPNAGPKVLADFDADTRVNKLGETFGAWNSSSPDPVAHCSESIVMGSGYNGSGVWRILYDIKTPGAFGGTWMRLGGADAAGYDTFRFRAKSSTGAPIAFRIEMKSDGSGSRQVGGFDVVGVGGDWKTIEIPLRAFHLPSLNHLYETLIIFNRETTGPSEGILLVDDIEFANTGK